ncbi:2-polyprenyl-6-methoxyphenol hydroxylase-like FAD-dependent oxidoreductase [Catenulispora sp. EB89]|uniref:FAD-dependent oxidoreductase n=1 Tax=Catenulispora sp. EB89 TaxID=3156257 RepID=UPI0035117539
MSELRVAIAGAGLAGLALARHLHRHGIDVLVLERDADLASRNPGYRLHVNSTGTSVLSTVLEPRLRELFLATAGIPRQAILHFDEHLNPGPPRDISGSVGGAVSDLPEHLVADRSTLRRVLISGLEDRVRFGARVTGYTHDEAGRVTAHLADGGSATADVLVAADGVNSAIRAQLLPHAEVVDLGARHIAAKVPLDDETRAKIPRDLFSMFTLIADRRHDMVTFGPLERSDPASPLIAERDHAFRQEAARDFALVVFSAVTDRLPPDAELSSASSLDLRTLALNRVADWHPAVVELIRMWDLDTVQPLVLRSSVPVPAWPARNVTVVGDAVHAMSPALGIGANTAFRDALALGEELVAAAEGRKPLTTAIADYEAAMRDYGFAAVRDSAAMGQRVIGHRPLPLPR